MDLDEHSDTGVEMTSSVHGNLSDGWYTEEDFDAVRLGLRVSAVLHEERSDFQKIVVCESEFFGRILFLDDLVMLTQRDEFVYHEMLTHVPLCGIENPRSVTIRPSRMRPRATVL